MEHMLKVRYIFLSESVISKYSFRFLLGFSDNDENKNRRK